MNESIKDEVLARITPRKVQHTLGCVKVAKELAIKWGGNIDDAENAALLHDVTKHFTKQEQIKYCEKYNVIIDDIEKSSYKLLHAKTAAEVAKHEYNMNESVYLGIKYHTTLRKNMTLNEKIMYLADYIEENRDFDGVEKARELAFLDIDEALRYCLDMTIYEIMGKKYQMHFDTVGARNQLYAMLESK